MQEPSGLSTKAHMPAAAAAATRRPNRYRRLKPSELQKRALVAPSHRVESAPEEPLLPGQCRFAQALDHERSVNPSAALQDAYTQLFPRVQSLALLLHNLGAVVDVMVERLALVSAARTNKTDQDAATLSGPSLLRLVGVLARDVGGDLVPAHLPKLVRACVDQVAPASVECTTQAMDALGELLVRTAAAVVERDHALACVLPSYGVLAHPSAFVRRLAAQAFACLLRRQPARDQKRHVRALLGAPGPGADDLADGAAQLVFHAVRGPQRSFSSRARRLLTWALLRGQPAAVERLFALCREHCEGDAAAGALADALALADESAAPATTVALCLRLCGAWTGHLALFAPACARALASPETPDEAWALAAQLFEAGLLAADARPPFALACVARSDALAAQLLPELQRRAEDDEGCTAAWVRAWRLACRRLGMRPRCAAVERRALAGEGDGDDYLLECDAVDASAVRQRCAVLALAALDGGDEAGFCACAAAAGPLAAPLLPRAALATRWRSDALVRLCVGAGREATLALARRTPLAAALVDDGKGEDALLRGLRGVAAMRADVEGERALVRAVDGLVPLAAAGARDAELAAALCASLLRVRFLPVWAPASRLVGALAQRHAADALGALLDVAEDAGGDDDDAALLARVLACVRESAALRSEATRRPQRWASLFLACPWPRTLPWLELQAALASVPAEAAARQRELLCAHPAAALKAALAAEPRLAPYRALLEPLADPDASRLRDALAATDLLAPSTGRVQLAERALVLDVAVRVLFARMLERPGRGDRFTRESRRGAVMAVLAGGLADAELALFFDLVLAPFEAATADAVTSSQQRGLVTTLGVLLARFGTRAAAAADRVLASLAGVLARAEEQKLRGACLDAIADALALMPAIADAWLPRLAPLLALASLRTSSPRSALFRLVARLLRASPATHDALLRACPALLDELAACVEASDEALSVAAVAVLADVRAPLPPALLPALASRARRADVLALLAVAAEQSRAPSDALLPPLLDALESVAAYRAALLSALARLVPLAAEPPRALARLFGPCLRPPLTARSERAALVELARALPEHAALAELNAFAVDGPDYARRLRAYERLPRGAKQQQPASALVQQALLDMQQDDFALRAAAQAWLEDCRGALAVAEALPGVWAGLECKTHELRRGFLQLLRALALDGRVEALLPLVECAEGEDDLLALAAHVQVARRARGLVRLARLVRDKGLARVALRRVALPLALHAVHEAGVERQELQQAGLSLAVACASRLPGAQVRAMLRGILLQAERQPQRARLLLRLACLVVDAAPREGLERLLPLLRRQLKGEDGRLRAHVAVTAAKLASGDAERASLLLALAAELAVRDQSRRDEARAAVVQVAKALGPAALPDVLSALAQTLRSGFQLKVLGATVHALLIDGAGDGAGDAAVPLVAPMIARELRQAPRDREAADARVFRGREAKSRALDSLELLAAGARDFAASVRALVDVARGAGELAEAALARVAAGLARNGAVTAQQLLAFAHTLLASAASSGAGDDNDGLEDDDGGGGGGGYAKRAAYEPGRRLTGHKREAADAREAPLDEFALSLARAALRGPVEPQYVRPLVPALLRGLHARAAGVRTEAVRMLGQLGGRDVLREGEWAQATASLLALLRDGGGGDAHKALLRVVRGGRASLDAEQTRALVEQVRADLGDAARRGGALQLLRALVERDVEGAGAAVGDAAELALAGEREADRAEGARVVAAYALRPGRAQAAVELLLRNLDYPAASGRLQCVRLLAGLCAGMPVELADDLCELLALPLALRLCNDDDAECARAAAGALSVLLSRVGANARAAVRRHAAAWLTRRQTRALACQVAGLLPDGAALAPQLLRAATGEGEDWQTRFHALAALVALGAHDVDTVDGELAQLLVHEHAWVRTEANKLVAAALDNGATLAPDCGFALVQAFVDQFDSDAFSDALAEAWLALGARLVRRCVESPAAFGTAAASEALYWLGKRIVRTARRVPERRRFAVALFERVVECAPAEELPASLMLGLLGPEDAATDALKSKLGAEAFVRALAQVREWSARLRDESKAAKRLRRVADPEAEEHAKKLKRGREKEARKRKASAR